MNYNFKTFMPNSMKAFTCVTKYGANFLTLIVSFTKCIVIICCKYLLTDLQYDHLRQNQIEK